MCKAREDFDSFLAYKKLVQFFIDQLEPFRVLHQTTLHLVVLKFNVIRKHLINQLKISTPNNFYCQLCELALAELNSSESKFITGIHFMSTLLSPGHRNQLRYFYSAEKIECELYLWYNYIIIWLFLDLENRLLDAICQSRIDELECDISDVLRQEFNRFLQIQVSPNTEPLDWWASNEKVFPNIAIFASRLFSVPAIGNYDDKILPPFLRNTIITNSLRRTLLYNWMSESVLQMKK